MLKVPYEIIEFPLNKTFTLFYTTPVYKRKTSLTNLVKKLISN